MSRPGIVLAAVGVILIIAGAILGTFWILGQPAPQTNAVNEPWDAGASKAEVAAAVAPEPEEAAPPPEAAPIEGMMTVRLYVLARSGRRLATEDREVPREGSLQQQATRVVELLLRRSSAIPRGVELRDVFVTSQGIAYVDLSRQLVDNHPGGSSAEELTVYSLANTLIANFPVIKMVKILVEGREIQTLAGHLDLTVPYGRAPAYLQPESERVDTHNEAS